MDFNGEIFQRENQQGDRGLKQHTQANGFLHLMYIFRAFHPKAVEYTYFSRAHGMFSRIDHMLGNKTSLNKFKRIEIIPSIFSDHNAIKLEINHKKNNKKHAKTNKLNDMLVNNVWVNNKIKEEIKDTLKQLKMKTQQSKI